ncbi:MAG TPA: hypothetical protein VNT26_11930, partial [Candidatus Sulfotelmatobacter sp.]|nr:hypothetical protein [Candidatus Sulfotelmatobacter sp.]
MRLLTRPKHPQLRNWPVGFGWCTAGWLAFAISTGPLLAAEPLISKVGERNVDGIMDNSFLVEEAYNQEKGVVQHILTAIYALDHAPGSEDQLWNLAFTQEWPLFSQTHQLSYTIPYNFARTGGQGDNGFGDVLLNYRYQAYFNPDTLMAFAPRASLVLPTGDKDLGFGGDKVGAQFNLPFSTTLGDYWFVHLNAGLTYLPEVDSLQGRDRVD